MSDAAALPPVTRALERVVRFLVDRPDEVRVEELRRGAIHVLDVVVAADDMGSVIGRGGRTAHALRSLVRLRGEREGISYDLKIREPQESDAPGRRGPGGEERHRGGFERRGGDDRRPSRPPR